MSDLAGFLFSAVATAWAWFFVFMLALLPLLAGLQFIDDERTRNAAALLAFALALGFSGWMNGAVFILPAGF